MKKIFILAFILSALSLGAQNITIDEILDGYEVTAFIPNLTASLSVKLISANGEVREIKADAYQKTVNENQVSRLFLFDYPPSVRNTGLLINSFLNGDENVMWIYLPAVKRVKRIALATSGGGYFMGSDFSYSDFISKARTDYTQEFVGEVVLNGSPCYSVKEYGKTLQRRQDMKLSYMINYYRKDDFIMYGRDYYDLAGELVKEYRVKNSIVLGQYIYPTLIEMENIQTGHRSIIEMTNVSTDIIPDRYFTSRFLKNK
ncbi:MAG: outer membrane lipoprotein-sorting protein [Spirochaetales bacterium]|nr:outer membrane lipoprotein-sorting protein [Spirochaetales bacterium]